MSAAFLSRGVPASFGKIKICGKSCTFENRGHTFTAEQFEQVMAFDKDEAMQKKWKAFVRKIDTKTDDYSTVLEVIKNFLIQPFLSAIKKTEFSEKWSVTDSGWL